MKTNATSWSKAELKAYILMLCAKVDNLESEEEIALIKTKTSEEIFAKMYSEFQNDNEEDSIEKIEDALERHQYSKLELCKLKNDIQQLFAVDRKIPISGSNLGPHIENIIY